jgi:polyferredoxin
MIAARLASMIQLVPAVLAENWWVVGLILAASILFGRVYCRFVCPLGILQSLVRLFRGPRRVCTRLRLGYGGRTRVAVNVFVLALFLALGLSGLGWQYLDPYAIAARAVCVFFAPEFDWVVWAFALVPATAILAAAALAGGRLWCNWVCPVGTVLAFVTRLSWRGDKVSKRAGCARCGKCFPSPAVGSGAGASRPETEEQK